LVLSMQTAMLIMCDSSILQQHLRDTWYGKQALRPAICAHVCCSVQVMAHGGQVVKSYSSKVTHVILYDPAALAAQATSPAAAGAPTVARSQSSTAALRPDATKASAIIASLQQQLLRAATPSSSMQHAGSSDRAAAQAAAVLGSAGVAAQGAAKGPAAMTQLGEQMQGPGGCFVDALVSPTTLPMLASCRNEH
jgi:hypothetical protein